MKILHIAPFNIAGIPFTLMRAEQQLGLHSRLITLGREEQKREADICLNLPFISVNYIKKIIYPQTTFQDGKKKSYKTIPQVWHPPGAIARKLFTIRDALWEKKVRKFLSTFHVEAFDVFQLDGGLGFLRSGKIIRELKSKNKTIICCYYGSDLRTRGVIPEIDKLSNLNVTFEYDHLKLHPHIYHIPFPFDVSGFQPVEIKTDGRLTIGHAPTNRKAKGTDFILSTLDKLKKRYNFDIVLIENLPYEKAMDKKRECTLFIDQISELGFGINSLEALALGIPVLSSLAEEFKQLYPDHPFIEVNKNNLYDKLGEILNNPGFLKTCSLQCRKWVEHYHKPVNVVRKIKNLLDNV